MFPKQGRLCRYLRRLPRPYNPFRPMTDLREQAEVPEHLGVQRHVTGGGARLYTLTLRAFPHLPVNAFLVLTGDPARPSYSALVDMGSSLEPSQQGLLSALEAIRTDHGEAWSWETLSRLIVTHPHPDHVGGLPLVRTLTAAPVAAHATGVPTLERPEARRAAQLAAIEGQLRRLGVPEGEYAERLRRRAGNLMIPSSVKVTTPLTDGDRLDGLFDVIHTPGHEGAQICLRVGEVLLSADHLLPRNSPPLMPAWMLPGGGLGAYLASLDRIEELEGVTLALGSHDGPMRDWRGRVRVLRERYADKGRAVLEAASTPQTAFELTLAVHPRLRSPQALLLLDQTAALAEYLSETGQLREERGPAGESRYTRR